MKLVAHMLRQVVGVSLTLAVGAFLGCVLLRFGPGFGTDEREMDARYSSATLQALRQARAGERNIWSFYKSFVSGAVHGDLGISTSLEAPVGELIVTRAPVTLRLIGSGLSIGWLAGLALGIMAAMAPRARYLWLTEALSQTLLCIPTAVLALIVYLINGPSSLVVAAAIFPRVYQHARTLLSEFLAEPRRLAAFARGISPTLIFLRYVLPPAVAPLVALLGITTTLAFGTAIPVEIVCDLPGLGQLAWKAAVARDLPLLAAMTLIVTAITLTANSAASLASTGRHAR